MMSCLQDVVCSGSSLNDVFSSAILREGAMMPWPPPLTVYTILLYGENLEIELRGGES